MPARHRRRTRVLLCVALLAGLLPLLAGPAQASTGCVNGGSGAGDPFFPLAGNGGYDVAHYGIDLGYVPSTGRLAATTTITATATVALCRFDLDFRGLRISGLTVDGLPAAYERQGRQELVVTPDQPLRSGHRFVVVVSYDGVPKPVTDANGSLDGWIRTDDGAFVVSEPQGSPTWYPCNDTPRDKATYDISATVPIGLDAVGNGELVARSNRSGHTTFHWRSTSPMSTYLSTLSTGRFTITTGRTASGIAVYDAVDPRERSAAAPTLRLQGGIVGFYSGLFGRYPFGSVGAIVDHAARVGYALETQTRPSYDRAPSGLTLAHELAHQWFGDSVTLAAWPQIWLNEGFATWASWWWLQHAGGPTTAQTFDELYASPASSDIWSPPPGRPGSAAHLLANSVYVRGGMTLEALRQQVGTATFLSLLRQWATISRYRTASIADFQALAERVSGRPLGTFFDVWLRRPGKPARW